MEGRINYEKVDNPRNFSSYTMPQDMPQKFIFTSVCVYDNSLLNMNDKSCLPLLTPVLLRGRDDIELE